MEATATVELEDMTLHFSCRMVKTSDGYEPEDVTLVGIDVGGDDIWVGEDIWVDRLFTEHLEDKYGSEIVDWSV